jgi:diguanylate cyclase (GGDEF)-like protein
MPALLREAREQGAELCFAVLDLDHFKRFNDTFGHQRGDEVLRLLCERFRALLEPGELLARMGGDEFVAVLRGDQAQQRLAAAAADFEREAEGLGRSAGCAPMLSVGHTRIGAGRALHLSQAYGEADAALYRAKGAGRGRVQAFQVDGAGATDAGRVQVASAAG